MYEIEAHEEEFKKRLNKVQQLCADVASSGSVAAPADPAAASEGLVSKLFNMFGGAQVFPPHSGTEGGGDTFGGASPRAGTKAKAKAEAEAKHKQEETAKQKAAAEAKAKAEAEAKASRRRRQSKRPLQKPNLG
jgi:hypothetical protein